jgi:hypothetical protein
LIKIKKYAIMSSVKNIREENFSNEQIDNYRERLEQDPDREITATEARAILGVTWNLLRNWLDPQNQESPLRWRKHPFDSRSKLIKLADVMALRAELDHLRSSGAPNP